MNIKIFEAFTGIGAWGKAFERLGNPIELVGFLDIAVCQVKVIYKFIDCAVILL